MTVETNRSGVGYDLFKVLVTLALMLIIVIVALAAQNASQAGEPPSEGPSEELAVGGTEAKAEPTVGTTGTEATVAGAEAEPTVAGTEAEPTVGGAEAEATATAPEAEATVGAPEAEATAAAPEGEATVEEPGAGEGTPVSSGAPAGQLYVVRDRDWLMNIALRFWGDPDLYPLIVEATNAKAAEDPTFRVITNPNRIYPEQKLWIPDR
jgi:nucleoid-associated protein YgaU